MTPPADPSRLSAHLGLGLEPLLRGSAPPPAMALDAWDAWWVTVRSGGRIRLPATRPVCESCTPAVSAGLTSFDGDCACFVRWARAVRADSRSWDLPQRLTVAMLKPGAPDGPIRARLRRRFRIVHDVTRRLRPADCVRLHPDAYGNEFIARRTAYLTSGTVRVLVLFGGDHAVAAGLEVKQAVRAELATDRMRNHLHTPDNPADALADIGLLAGFDILRDLYLRWEAPHERHARGRLAAYRARLDR